MIRQTLVGVFAALALSAGMNAETISDGDFSNWSFTASEVNGGIANANVFPSGGNPGAYLQIGTSTGVAPGTERAGINAIYLGYSTSAALSGAFELGLDVNVVNGFGQGQALAVIVDQGGTIYSTAVLGVTGAPVGWTTETFDGTFLASDFTLISGSGPAQPDFSGGTQTYFGFGAGNQSSQNVALYYDNFSLSNPSLSSSPEPSSFYLITGGALVVASIRLRRNTPPVFHKE